MGGRIPAWIPRSDIQKAVRGRNRIAVQVLGNLRQETGLVHALVWTRGRGCPEHPETGRLDLLAPQHKNAAVAGRGGQISRRRKRRGRPRRQSDVGEQHSRLGSHGVDATQLVLICGAAHGSRVAVALTCNRGNAPTRTREKLKRGFLRRTRRNRRYRAGIEWTGGAVAETISQEIPIIRTDRNDRLDGGAVGHHRKRCRIERRRGVSRLSGNAAVEVEAMHAGVGRPSEHDFKPRARRAGGGAHRLLRLGDRRDGQKDRDCADHSHWRLIRRTGRPRC